MKRLIYILILGCLTLGLSSCEQEINYPYSGKDRIQFRHYTTNSQTGQRTYSESLVVSFGLSHDSVRIDTAKIVMEYLGQVADYERTYYVSVVADSSTAVEGVHYKVINRSQTFRPNKLTDTLRIVVYRDQLGTSFRTPHIERIDLKLEASEDFDLGLGKGIKKKVLINNYLSEPVWWYPNFISTLGFYHPEKWKILISFDKKFANHNSCPYDRNNKGKSYATDLGKYLKEVAVYDKETGDRIYKDELIPQE